MSHIGKTFGVLFIALLLSFNLQAAENAVEKNLFITLISGDDAQTGMGMAIANAMQDAGVHTTVLVGAKSVGQTLKKGHQPAFGPTGVSVRRMMASLVKKGGSVMLCGMCAKNNDVTMDDVAESVRIVGPSEVYGALFAPNTQTLSF